MTADQTVERAANKLRQLAGQMAGEGGVKARLAQPLAEDADFIRKLKPSLIKARVKGEAPMDQKPGQAPVAPSSPQLGERPKPKKRPGGGGPNPWLIAGAALAAGIFLAKWVDWRGYAYPRD
jgi:hypothetical protein